MKQQRRCGRCGSQQARVKSRMQYTKRGSRNQPLGFINKLFVLAVIGTTSILGTTIITPTYGQATADNNEIEYDGVAKIISNDVNPEDLKRMKEATWLNSFQVAMAVDFTDPDQSPYPPVGGTPYDVTIDPNANCYVVFRDIGRTKYDLITAAEPPTGRSSGERQFGVFLSHETPCGVCSNLADLAVYLEKPDLTNPVRLCGFTSFISNDISINCLKESVGFSDDCAAIWYHNVQYTRSNCFLLCIALLTAPSNQKYGFENPCDPSKCETTINQAPACQDFQYENGNDYRLNACLQCDECKSGPLFQKIAGRTRRASGIYSGIDRPDIPYINHNYFTTAITYKW